MCLCVCLCVCGCRFPSGGPEGAPGDIGAVFQAQLGRGGRGSERGSLPQSTPQLIWEHSADRDGDRQEAGDQGSGVKLEITVTHHRTDKAHCCGGQWRKRRWPRADKLFAYQ